MQCLLFWILRLTLKSFVGTVASLEDASIPGKNCLDWRSPGEICWFAKDEAYAENSFIHRAG